MAMSPDATAPKAQSPGEHVDQRIHPVGKTKAGPAQVLRQPGMQVTQAAYLSGFNHLSYFAKCFREQYGMSPSAYAAAQSSD